MKRRHSRRRVLATLVALSVLGLIYVRAIHWFLAPVAPINAHAVIVEGWMPDAELEVAARIIRARNYATVIVTGGPLDQGNFLSDYRSFAEVGRATISRLTGRTDILAVSAPAMQKDRTYASALALKAWLDANGNGETCFNLISSDAHTRRSWRLFETALGGRYTLGALAIAPQSYDARRWWAYSEGFKTVTGETLAYLYTVLVFPFTQERLPPELL